MQISSKHTAQQLMYQQAQMQALDQQQRKATGGVLKNAAEQQMQHQRHILMNQQHVKLASPTQEAKDNTSTKQPISHKKANSLINQKMMQLLHGNQQMNNPGHTKQQQQQIAQGYYVGVPNTMSTFQNNQNLITTDGAQQYLHSDFVSVSADYSNIKSVGKQYSIQQQKQSLNSDQKIIMNSLLKQKVVQSSKQISETGLGTKKSIKPKIISNSFDKTSGQKPNSVKQPITKGKITHIKKIKNSMEILTKNKKVPQTTGIPSVLHTNLASGMATHAPITHAQVSGQQSIMSGSASNLHDLQQQSQVPTIQFSQNISSGQQALSSQGGKKREPIDVQTGHHRTMSDANYIQQLQNNQKNTFVISSSNHVYQSKKAANLKSMSNNNHVSSQGATKGLLNKLTQQQARGGKQSMHKKGQASIIVKSKYQNLIQQEPGIIGCSANASIVELREKDGLDVFESNQNKTTEQKYQELKLKYNDLLNKHLYLAAQKTEDNSRVKYLKSLRKKEESINSQHYPQTQQQTIDQIENEIYGGAHKIVGATTSGVSEADYKFKRSQRKSDMGSQGEEDIYPGTIGDEEQFHMIVGSQNTSQNQTPRDFQFHPQQQHSNERLQHYQGGSQNISSATLNQNIYQVDPNCHSQKSKKSSYQQYTASQVNHHKRSVSDGVFGFKQNMIPLKQHRDKGLVYKQSVSIQDEQQNIAFDGQILEETDEMNTHSQGGAEVQQTLYTQQSLTEGENVPTEHGAEINLKHKLKSESKNNEKRLKLRSGQQLQQYAIVLKENPSPQQKLESERKGKKKKTKSMIQSELVSDNNKLALKYKQIRKTGEYAPGISSDSRQKKNVSGGRQQPVVQIKASGVISDRFGPSDIQKTTSKKAGVHRRVKSGASDQTNGFAQKQEQPVVNVQISNVPSIRSLGKVNKGNFMLIYEDEEGEKVEKEAKKIVNVSFNDFSEGEYSRENSRELINEKTEPLSQMGQIQTTNQNVNNFLEALQKIKPQRPVKQVYQYQEPPQKKVTKKVIKNTTGSSISGNMDQVKLEKYHKMMQKAKQNDKKVIHHQRIKSTNEGVSQTGLGLQSKKQVNRSMERDNIQKGSTPVVSKQKANVSQGISDSNKNVKITFVGEQALLMNHSKKGSQSYMNQIQFHQGPTSKYMINSASGSNSHTGGQPSPIISTKRVPQKILNNPSQVKKDNFIEPKPKSKIMKSVCKNAEIFIYEQDDVQAISDFDESVNLIQNLNKGPKNFQSLESEKELSPNAPQVSERLVTEESNKNNSPRTKAIRKVIKMIRLCFRQNNGAPSTTIDFYRIGKILGKGAFGKVNLAVHKVTECLCAVKSINKQFFSDESQSKKVMQEVVMLKKTRHKNIVRLYEYFETEKHILFVIELCAGGDLLNYVRRRRRLKEDVAKYLFKQIIESLAYCHSKNILHRDIKLDNILLDASGVVKICDFGVGKIVKKGEKMTEQCGTPAYIAPEILRDQGYYGFAVDVWSAGVVLYAMLYGTVPFKATNMTELQKMIMKAKYTLKDDISQEARNLLKGLMEKDPAKRMTIAQVLNHKWLEDAKTDHTQVELFTEQEKQFIKTEYSYTKSKRYNRNPDFVENSQADGSPIDLDKDMFTEHLLDSTQNSILKNCETKSVILAPFNSTKSNLDEGQQDNISLSSSIKDLIEDRKIIKFGARVRDIDRQYEINNNADLDNGVYHKAEDEEEEEKKQATEEDEDESSGQNQDLNDPENVKNDLDEEEQEIMMELKKQGQKKKKQAQKVSELQKLEDMIQEEEEKDQVLFNLPEPYDGGNVVTENSGNYNLTVESQNSIHNHHGEELMKIVEQEPTSTDFAERNLKSLLQQQMLEENLAIKDDIIQLVEEIGYPRDYIYKCLNQNELNYCTTSYKLLHFTKPTRKIINSFFEESGKQQMLYHDSNIPDMN